MNILVTGGGGYIGSHAIKRLLKEGHTVIALDNFSRGWREPLEILKKYGNLKVEERDLRLEEDVSSVFKKHEINLVMHFAALCAVDESMKKPEDYFKNNTLGTLNLLEAMASSGVRNMVFSSTCAVYGTAAYLPVDEKHPLLPDSPYGESKLMAEKITEWFGRIYDMRYVILRYFNVCGADQEGEIGDSKKPSELLVQNAVLGALGLRDFELTCGQVGTPDGTPVRDYIDVEDLIEAHMRALAYLENGGASEIFNLGNGKGWSVKEVADAVKAELGRDFPVKKGIQRSGESAEVYADVRKAKNLLAWYPRKNLGDSIKALAGWYKNKPNGYER